MPTTLYATDTLSSLHPMDSFAAIYVLSFTRGDAATSVTDVSTVAGGLWGGIGGGGSTNFIWISEPLEAVVISGQISANIRALESNAMANYGVGFRVGLYTTSYNQTGILQNTEGAIELATTESARTVSGTPSGSKSVAAGNRIGIELRWTPDVGGSAGTGYNLQGFFDGPTGGASGDTFVTFAETITAQGGGPPAVRVPYRNRMPSLIAQ